MEDELLRIKRDRQKLQLQKQQDDATLVKLIQELEVRKEKELKDKIEKEEIIKEMKLLEKKKLTKMEKNKKNKLEKLKNERELIAMKEQELMNEIKGLSGKVDELNKIQREERERVGNVTKNIIEKRKKNKNVNDMLLKEKSE